MWPFTKRSSSCITRSPFAPRGNKEEFLKQNGDLLIQKLLRDAFSYGLSLSKTPVPLYPTYNVSLGKTEGNLALSLFEVCHHVIENGHFRYTYLHKTHGGYTGDLSLAPHYDFYQSFSPFSANQSIRFTDLLSIPLGILYEINQSFLLKQTLFRDKLVLYVDGLRAFGNQTSASFVDIFRDSVKSQAKEIFGDSALWIFDAKDRIEQPPFISSDVQTSIDFAYSEISRILGIPQTHLLGKSPDGQNATGKSDEENYQKILRGLLDSLILPILKVGDPSYNIPHSLQTDKVYQTLEVLKSLQSHETGLSDTQKKAIKDALLANLNLNFEEPSEEL